MRLFDFLYRHRVAILFATLAFVVGQRTVKPEVVKLVTDKIVTVTERVPYGVPQPFVVQLPGSNTRTEVKVEREKVTPGQDRIITKTEPVYCKTQAECDLIYNAAIQRILVNAFIKQGTPVPVLLNGAEVNLPLARNFDFSLRLVMSEPGVFHGLADPGSPLGITNVQTGTLVSIVPVPRASPFLSRIKPTLALPAGIGLSYELGRVSLPIIGRFSADAITTFWPSLSAGLGVSKGIGESFDLGLGYVVGGYTGPVLYGTWRP